MDDVTRHPDDDVLFDLVDGALEPARAEGVRRHLARCGACAAFVEAATSGAEAARGLVEPMPVDLDSRLHVAVRGAWRERREAVAAGEAATDPEPMPGLAQDASGIAEPASARAPETVPARSRRVRRWIPVVAFAMLATLAGASLFVGDDRVAPERGVSSDADSAAEDEVGEVASAPSVAGDPGVPEANEISGGAGSGLADAARDAEAGPAAAAGAEGADDAAFEVPPVGLEDDDVFATGEATVGGDAVPTETEADLTCFATLDEAALVLPDGRLAVQVLRGPLGIYVVCG